MEKDTRPIFASARIMITALVLITVSFNLAISQPHNDEYQFRVQSTIMGDKYSDEDEAPRLTMDCLSANGYGQWTSTSLDGISCVQFNSSSAVPLHYTKGWYLLANGLYKPSVRFDGTSLHPDCIPPGVVQNGAFDAPKEVKACSNEFGTTCYVWVDPNDHSKFQVRYFMPSNVDISLGFMSNPHVLQTGEIWPPNKVVTSGPIVPTPTISFTQSAVCDETDFRDWFDIACDGSYLYIVWCSNDDGSSSVPSHTIWTAAIVIGTSNVVSGYPLNLGEGVRPTCACSRNDGQVAPEYYVAHITQVPSASCSTCTGTIVHHTISGTTATVNTVNNQFHKPNDCSNLMTIGFPLHVRALKCDGHPLLYAITTANGNSAFESADGGNTLIYWNPISSYASYVDGKRTQMSSPKLPWPPGAVGDPASNSVTVVDAPITAFVDDYNDPVHCLYQLDAAFDAGSGNTINRKPLVIVLGAYNFVCDMSRQDTRLVLNQTASHVLLPDPGNSNNLAGDGIPNWYVGAVNQMGIHVHWIGDSLGADNMTHHNVHYYARDTGRTFNANIVENTLVTDICRVTNGNTTDGYVHVLEGAELTLWTDPNYGSWNSGPNHGLYQPRNPLIVSRYSGQLSFEGNNAILFVDAPGWCDGTRGRIANMPYSYFNFEDGKIGQNIIVRGAWDYYGLISLFGSNHTPFTNGANKPLGASASEILNGGGTIKIQGGDCSMGNGERGWTDANPGNLIVHAGADFFIGDHTNFIVERGDQMSSGRIDVLFGAGISQLSSSSATNTNPNITGHLTLHGQTTLYGDYATSPFLYIPSGFYGHVPWNSTAPVMSDQIVMNVDNSTYSGLTHFLATQRFHFENAESDGLSELDFGGEPTTAQGDDVFDTCTFNSIRICSIDPVKSFEVKQSTFENIRGKCIFVNNDFQPTGLNYGRVLIEGNSFGAFSPKVDAADATTGSLFFDLPYGIYIKNFDLDVDPNATSIARPMICYNNFLSSQWNVKLERKASSLWNDQHYTNAAIGLQNTTALVFGNDIEDPGYQAGISMITVGFTPPQVFSLLCSNTIKGYVNQDDQNRTFESFGVIANKYYGLMKWNTIDDNEVGVILYKDNFPNLLGNEIIGSLEVALDVQAPSGISSQALMSGYPNRLDGTNNHLNAFGFYSADNEQGAVIEMLGDGASIDIEGGLNRIWLDHTRSSPSTNWLLKSATTNTNNIGSIDGNWWGTGVTPPSSNNGLTWGANCFVDDNHLQWTATSGGTKSESETALPTPGNCTTDGSQLVTPAKRGMHKLSLADSATCTNLYWSLEGYLNHRQYQALFDSGRKFIELCYDDARVSQVFGLISASTQGLFLSDTGIFLKYREWLKTVIYLNTTDSWYFCRCVEEIGGTYRSASDSNKTLLWKDQNRGLAIAVWLMHNTGCDSGHALSDEYNGTRSSQRADWLRDTTVPYDTTLPPLSQLDHLDTLLAKHFLVKPPDGVNHGPKILTTVATAPNPTNTGTVLTFGMAQNAYVRIELYDLLGNVARGSAFEQYMGAGNHSVPIDMSALPSGTYYARIVTAYGETRTVKIVKK